MSPSEHFVNQAVKILPQLSGLRLWYCSINFGYEINLKVLRYLVFIRPKIGNREKQQGKHGKYPKKLGYTR